MISDGELLANAESYGCVNPAIIDYNGYQSKISFDCKYCGIRYTKSYHLLKISKSPVCIKCIKYNIDTIPVYTKSLGFNYKSIVKIDGSFGIVECLCECGNSFTSVVSQLKFRRTKSCEKCILRNKSSVVVNVESFLSSKGVSLVSNYTNNKTKISLRCSCGNIFSKNYNDCTRKDSSDILLCQSCRPQNSSIENNIEKTLINNSIQFVKNDRSVLKPMEIDFLCGSIAIEVNGAYWHSELAGKSRNYHLNKTQLCENQNIQLLQFFENEILNKSDIVKSIILSKFQSKLSTVYARKTTVCHISKTEARKFIDLNHLQGKDNASVYICLKQDGNIIAVMSFSKSRYSKLYEWELSRFCSKLFTKIIGGASKLLSFFIKNYSPTTIGSYADRRYSNGNLYSKLGFIFIHNSKPSYYYFRKSSSRLLHRKNFQKKRLAKIFSNFDAKLTEWNNMINNGYNRIWDCGHKLFIMKVT